MASLYTHQDANVRKTWFLMTLFFLIVIGAGWGFSYVYDIPEILWVAVIVSIGMNLFAYWNADKVALRVSGAKPAARETHGELFASMENLAITAGLPMPRLYVIDDPVPNAFATGRNAQHAAIAVTNGLLRLLDKNELEGVLAHELSHVGNRDILLSTVVVVLVGFIALLSDIFLRVSIFGGRRGDDKAGGVLALVGIVLIILSPIVATLIQLAISRKREFLADASGALLTRYPEGLASALKKIGEHGGKMRRASNATAHLFIANPFGARASRGVAKLFMTHPPVEERINALLGR